MEAVPTGFGWRSSLMVSRSNPSAARPVVDTSVHALSVTNPVTYDYSRSFVQWTGQSKHVPRCTIQASCRLRTGEVPEREFFLTHPCAGETMYADKNLIQFPTADFHMVCEPG